MRLNIGSGGISLSDYGYLDVDIVEEWNPDIVADARDLWMFENESCEEVFAKDVIEHMGIFEWRDTLKEWIRVLKPGGLLKIRYPNLEHYIDEYHNDIGDEQAWDKLCHHIFGHQDFEENTHKCGLNYWVVKDFLEDNGMIVLTDEEFKDGGEQRITACKGEKRLDESVEATYHPDYIFRSDDRNKKEFPK